jgi:hypothetical protein
LSTSFWERRTYEAVTQAGAQTWAEARKAAEDSYQKVKDKTGEVRAGVRTCSALGPTRGQGRAGAGAAQQRNSTLAACGATQKLPSPLALTH